MKRVLSLLLSVIIAASAVFAVPATAQAKGLGKVKNAKVKMLSVYDEYDGFACYTVDFSAVKNADGYQIKYYWAKDEVFTKNIKKNRFRYETQDILPTCKVRAYKKGSNGKKTYGAWTVIKWKGTHDYSDSFSYSSSKYKKLKAKYPLLNNY